MKSRNHFSLDQLIDQAIEQYERQDIFLSPTTKEDVLQFILDRFRIYLREQGIDYDVVEAILADKNASSIGLSFERAKALQSFLRTEPGVALKTAYKRASGILSKDASPQNVNPQKLLEPAEKELYEKLCQVEENCQSFLNSHQYSQIMNHLANLRSSIDVFFDTVTVNCEDLALKENRYALLHKFIYLMDQVGDFSKLQG